MAGAAPIHPKESFFCGCFSSYLVLFFAGGFLLQETDALNDHVHNTCSLSYEGSVAATAGNLNRHRTSLHGHAYVCKE